MNVLELCLSSGLGGLELYVFRSAEALENSQSNKNNVLAVLTRNSKLDDYFNKNSTIKTQYIKRFFNPLPLFNAKKLAAIIDKNNIDVIHMHWGKDFALAAFAKVFSKRKPKLVYTRQMMITRYKNDLYHRFLYSQLDLIITITRQLEQLYKKYVSVKNLSIRTLYYGVKKPESLLSSDDISRIMAEKNFDNDDFVIGLFGRLEDGKGQHLLIKALSIAEQNDKHIKALIVGHEMDAGYRDTLTELAESLGVLENITFNDFVVNPQELMQVCDCVCLTTYEETFGLVLPEAMRAGVAVIGSDSGGVPEIIDHQKTGLLFESKNEESLYQQIAYFYDNPEVREKIASSGKDKADTMFDNDEHFQKLETLLSKAAE